MSIKLRDLIKSVRACKTAAEERAVIRKELANIRTAFKSEDNEYRHRNVAKLLYINMLGYPTQFGQMECLRLISSPNYSDKRIGYLALMLLLDERQEVLTLATHSMKNDLNHPNQYVVGLALCSLANLASTGMARDVASDIEKLLGSSNPYIRKKAAICAIRIIKKVPEIAENFVQRVKPLLNERNHGVLLTSVALVRELSAIDASYIPQFRPLVPQLVRILKNLVHAGYAPEHDVSGITDPFLQAAVLNILGTLGAGDAEASDAMNDILAQVATNTENVRNVGNAILYECVKTIMSIQAESALRTMAINILGRFLLHKDNNIRYVALNTLSRVVTKDIQAVQRHRNTIVDCLKDNDVSIRRRALDLIYSLVNESNIRVLMHELINFLLVCEQEFKQDLTAKLCDAIQKYSPNKRWYVDTLLRVLAIAGNYVQEDVISGFVSLVSNTPDLQPYAVQRAYLALCKDLQQQPLVQLGVWCIGEYGDLLVSTPLADSEADQPAPARPSTVKEAEVVDLLEAVLRSPLSGQRTREHALTALMKLAVRFKPDELLKRIEAIIKSYTAALNVELQQRACEYAALFALAPAVRANVLDRMPPMEQAQKEAQAEVVKLDEAPRPAAAPAAAAATSLLDLDALVAPKPAASAGPSGNALLELLGGPAAAAPLAGTGATVPATALMGGNPLDDVFGPSPILAPSSGGNGAVGLVPGMAAPLVAPPAQAFPSFVAYDANGLKIVFDFEKPPSNPAQTNVNITCTNSTGTPMTNFVFLASVPKHIQLKLLPPSGSSIPANLAGSVTQQMQLVNSLHGQKPLVLRIKVDYQLPSGPVSDQKQINLPKEL